MIQDYFSPSDISACANVGRVLGLRCAMAGIHFLQDIDTEHIKRSAHVSCFAKNRFKLQVFVT